MALLFMDGFSGGDSTVGKWDVASGGYSVGSATPRTPGGYYGNNSLTNYFKTIPAAAKVVVGFGMYTNTAPNISFYGDAGATTHISVVRNSGTGFLEIRRGNAGGTLLATGTTPIPNNAWNYVEASATISDTIGEVHVRLNGLNTDEVSFVGDTKNAGTNTTIDRILVYSGNGAVATSYVADVYVLNSVGAINNDFLGDVAVRTLSPNGNGTYSQLTNSAATSVNNYTYVNEHAYSGTQYAGSPVSGLRDTYAIADVPAGVVTIYGVQVNGFMAKSDVSAGIAKMALISGGTLYYGSNRGLSTSYQTYYDLYENNPNTGIAWTVATVNNAEIGMEVV